jgi:cytochrome c
MNRAKCLLVAALPCLLAFAQTPTSTQAVALVKQALAYAKQNGMAKLIEETNSPNGKFHVSKGGELYLYIYDDRAMTKASGYQPELFVGKNRWDLRDPDGVMILQELLRVAKTQGRGWVDYKYPNPSTGIIDQKTSYCEYYEGMMIGCGIYKEKD